MAKLQLQIKLPGSGNTCILAQVERTAQIGPCISFFVDHLGLPRQDDQGRVLTYRLRPLSGDPPRFPAFRFADVHLLPDTHLVLEIDRSNELTQPFHVKHASNVGLHRQETQRSLKHSPFMKRRTFVMGGVLGGCTIAGLMSGAATALAIRRSPRPAVPPASPLPDRLQPRLRFSGHQIATVQVVHWSPDGTTLASGSDDGALLLWTEDGHVHHHLSHPTGVTALAWSPSGKLLVSGSGQSIRFFDAQTGTLLAPARTAHSAPVSSVIWSQGPNPQLISGSNDTRALVWETEHYRPQAVFSQHTAAIEALSSQPRSTTIASASQGGVIRLWNAQTLQELHGF